MANPPHRRAVTYDWDCEAITANGDVIDHHHSDTLREALDRHRELLARGHAADIALVRDVGSERDGIIDRQWAYYVGGALPEEFSGRAVVPKRFHDECRKATAELNETTGETADMRTKRQDETQTAVARAIRCATPQESNVAEDQTVEMPLSDVSNLDDVVRLLGIEDGDITPASAIAALQDEVIRLRVANQRLRERIARFHNHDLHEIRNRIEQVFLDWLPEVRKANREALRPQP